MNPRDLSLYLQNLDERLTTLEQVVQLLSGRLNPETERPEPATHESTAVSVAPVIATEPPAESSSALAANPFKWSVADPEPTQIEPLQSVPQPASVGQPHRSAAALEVQIGTRWVAWAGALLVILAAGFFVKLAYDNGWLRIPPVARCWLAAGFGFAMLGAGELTLRKINRRAATSLYATGLGVLYLTAYASCKYFHLVDEGTAFVLLAGVAVLGIGITLRGQLAIIGAISLVGGYGAPLLLQNAAGSPLALPLYMTFLLVTALTLSARQAELFRPLRTLTCILHAGLTALWLHQGITDFGLGTLLIVLGWWALVGTELALAAARNQSSTSNAVISGLATFWLAGLGGEILVQTGHADLCGRFLGVVACTVGFAAYWRGGGITALQTRPQHAAELLGASLWIQAGTLLVLSVGVHFSGGGIEEFSRTFGWLLLGVGGIELGRRLRARSVEIYGVIVGALALIKCLLIDAHVPALQSTLWSGAYPLWGDVCLTRWTLLAVVGVLATLVAGMQTRLTADARPAPLPMLMSGAGLLLWLHVTGQSVHGLFLPILWLAAWAGLHAFRCSAERQGYAELAVVALLAAALRWFAMDAAATRFAGDWSATALLPFANPPMLVAASIVAAFWRQSRAAALAEFSSLQAGRTPSTVARQVWLNVGAIFMLIAFSFEVDRMVSRPDFRYLLHDLELTRALSLMVLWGLGSLGLLLTGFRRGYEHIALTGVILLLVDAASWLAGGSLAPRLMDGTAAALPVFNLQFGSGLLLLVLLAIAARRSRKSAGTWSWPPAVCSCAWSAVLLLGLWLGSLELDRAISWSGWFANQHATRQAAFSVFWGLYGIAMVSVGFARRAAALRYAGLTLLGLTLIKVVLVDLADAETVYRVLSFLGLGLVLIVTSVTYARLSDRLLPRTAPPM